MSRRAVATLVLACATLPLAAATVAGAPNAPTPAFAVTGLQRPLADVPAELLDELAAIDRRLEDLIGDVREEVVGPEGFRARVARIAELKRRATRLFPPLHGLEFRLLFVDFETIDLRLDDARAAFPNVGRMLEQLRLARERTSQLRKDLASTEAPLSLLQRLSELERGIAKLRDDLTDASPAPTAPEVRTRIAQLEQAKRRAIALFPDVFGLGFGVVYRRLELLDAHLRLAREAFTDTDLTPRGRRATALRRLEQAKEQKEKLETALRAQAKKLALGIAPSHTDDRVCLLVETEPGTTIDYAADGPAGYRSEGTVTLGPDETAVYAVSIVREPGEYTLAVEGTREGKPPVARTTTYAVPDLDSEGPFECPAAGPEPPPADAVECSGTIGFFGVVDLELIAALLCSRSERFPSRAAHGVAITRFDIQLPGGRGVTNWLAPPGFSCLPVTRSTANDTLRCSGTLPLDQEVKANVRMDRPGTAGMGASLYVLADGAEQGPFALTGP